MLPLPDMMVEGPSTEVVQPIVAANGSRAPARLLSAPLPHGTTEPGYLLRAVKMEHPRMLPWRHRRRGEATE